MGENRWQFFTSTEATWRELLSACKKAQHSIDLEQYVFGYGGEIEEAFTQLFIEKAKAGVTVRLLFDAVGSFHFYYSFAHRRLRKAGVQIHFHLAIFPPPLKRLFPVVLRDHRKLLVVDGEEAYIGGVIIEERARKWRDTFVRFEGPVVGDMRQAFDTVWKRTLRNRPVGQVKSENVHKEFIILGNSFHLHNKDLYRGLLRVITGAKKYIYITTPYFFPGKEFLRALLFARKRGVDIVMLFPKFSDNWIADKLAKLYYGLLRRRGIRIFLYKKNVLHAKTMVVDGEWATVGSCNMDLLSFWLNYELNVVSTNQNFALDLEKQFFDDLIFSEEVQ